MIECRRISKKFGAFQALGNVSFNIPSKKCYGFLGQNGAGKTTVLRMLVGLLRPDQGEIFVAGHSLLNERQQVQRLCGYLPQRPEFYPWLSGEEFLRLSAELVGVPARQAKKIAGKYLDTVGLADFSRRRVGKYSGGMQQRLGLAAALIGDPPVLLLDEPVSALDPQGRDSMFSLLKKLKQEKTIFLSSHILHDIEQVCDGVVIIHKGQIKAQGTMPELLKERDESIVRAQVHFEVDGGLINRLQAEFSGTLQGIGIPVSNVAWQEQGLEQLFYKVVRQAEEEVEQEHHQHQNSSTGQGGAGDGNMAR
ncbi:ABC transporter ATP-binding protein [Desulfosporosinus shakirovi]|uniref:ABC transporter ATP-binding protein n=1 Tax=Desulfosporosinus shakirovi TaxID=2885154 RepID=UPI001E3E7180|nr:ABC transporter ATP-binding protein [Desulfosporosinus sp. SRJS8]MCB8818546.1 ABC transporter ATP-binding protein [Desulfosporosinus sp. SRJS8]